MTEKISRAELEGLLDQGGIDIAEWLSGGRDRIDELLEEIRKSESALNLDPLLRIVEVVRLCIRQSDIVLAETGRRFKGSTVWDTSRIGMPSEKLLNRETSLCAARRCLDEELRLRERREGRVLQ